MNRETDREAPFDRRSIPADASETMWRSPDGHEIRTIDWPCRSDDARGSLLFLPGRGDFYEKYLETLEYWAQEGWRVSAADWRGQAYSGRLGADERAGHVADFSIWVDDLADFWAAWKAARPGPHVIVAHSMGGHIALRALAEGRIDPDALALSAPMLGIQPSGMPLAILHLFARVMRGLFGADKQAWRGSEKPFRDPDNRFDLLTHDEARYADEVWWRKERPKLWLGAPSWGWIERAIASARFLKTDGLLEAIATPVLFVATDSDRLVSYPAIAAAAGRIPGARLVHYGEEARHELLREEDGVRGKVLGVIDQFFDEEAPPQ
ncbi:MAG: alpha/beta hydrolase [Sphingomonadaceae bacterium]